MTEAETEVRKALVKMTPGEWIAIDDGVCVVDDSKWDSHGLRTLGSFRSRANAAGIVALRNHTPALLAELDAARAEVRRLREALSFYANVENWRATEDDIEEFGEDASLKVPVKLEPPDTEGHRYIVYDCGEIARAALDPRP